MRVDALAVARDLRELLPHALVRGDPGGPGAGVGDTEEEAGEAEVALDVREDAVPVQGRPDERGRLGVPMYNRLCRLYGHPATSDQSPGKGDAPGHIHSLALTQ